MLVTYDPVLVILSVILGMLGAYTCFELTAKVISQGLATHKGLLVGAAFAIGGGIWSMHFVGMLALRLPVTIQYDILLTLVSSLVGILMTGIALLVLTSGRINNFNLIFPSIIMGCGISSMHYIGMSAVRGNCAISYSSWLVTLSILVSIIASYGALWFALRLKIHSRKFIASIVMGLAISGMHYTGMLAATFMRVDTLLEYSAPIVNPYTLAILVSIATFLILGFTLLTFVPDSDSDYVANTSNQNRDRRSSNGNTKELQFKKLPVLKDRKTVFIDYTKIASIKANGHYTTIYTEDKEYFCSFSLTKLLEILDPNIFLRVHRSYVINFNYAEAFERVDDHGTLVLKSKLNQSVPVSRSKVSELRKTLGI